MKVNSSCYVCYQALVLLTLGKFLQNSNCAKFASPNQNWSAYRTLLLKEHASSACSSLPNISLDLPDVWWTLLLKEHASSACSSLPNISLDLPDVWWTFVIKRRSDPDWTDFFETVKRTHLKSQPSRDSKHKSKQFFSTYRCALWQAKKVSLGRNEVALNGHFTAIQKYLPVCSRV